MKKVFRRNPRFCRCWWGAVAALIVVFSQTMQGAFAAQDPLALAPVFSDGMVLQRNEPVSVFGTAVPGNVVEVKIAEVSASATTSPDGRWLVTLQEQPDGGPHQMMVTSGENSITLQDIYYGEVWFAGGQSNMRMFLYEAEGGEAAAAQSDPLLRFITIPRVVNEELPPQDPDIPQGWRSFAPPDSRMISAAGYWFAKELRAKLGVPVGLILCNYGGTPIEGWMSREALDSTPRGRAALTRYDALLASKSPEEHRAACEAFRKSATGARSADAPNRRKPMPPGPYDPRRPGGLFETMVRPVIPYTVAGFLFYQGEGNAGMSAGYAELFKALIVSWRKMWGRETSPFYFVQLSAYDGRPAQDWAALRAEQAEVAADIPATGMVVSLDVGHETNIHPPKKREVGERLARLALAGRYGLDVASRGPTIRDVKVEGGHATVQFDNVGGGLRTANDEDVVHGMEFECDRGSVVAAVGTITAPNTVSVRASDEVTPPARISAIRYGWSNFPRPPVNLINSDGLPSEPFHQKLTTQPTTTP